MVTRLWLAVVFENDDVGMTFEERIGANLRSRREARGLSREAVAGRCRLSPALLASIENGHRQLGLEAIVEVAAVLQTSVGALCRGVEWDQMRLRMQVWAAVDNR